MTDYEAELAKIESELAELDGAAAANPHLGTEGITKRAYRLYQRASLSGRLDQFAEAEAAIADGLQKTKGWPDLWLLRANLDLKFHRLKDVKCALSMATGLAESCQGQVLLADVAFQEGRYGDAKAAYERLVAQDRSWDNVARLAYWESKFGGSEQADRLYKEAEDEITAKEMRSFAWVQLQRGLIALRNGRYAEAAAHYNTANQAYSGYWLTTDHQAELLGAQGHFAAAVPLYAEVLATNPRPELQQAFGELYASMARHTEAEEWFDRALAGFLKSVGNGGVAYYHHLVDFYSDVRTDGAEAVRWGLLDFELRPNFATEGALAWAYYCDEQIPLAQQHMDHALASGASEAHLFAKAAQIYEASGEGQKAAHYLQLANTLNPDHHTFHVHRS